MIYDTSTKYTVIFSISKQDDDNETHPKEINLENFEISMILSFSTLYNYIIKSIWHLAKTIRTPHMKEKEERGNDNSI